MPELPEIEVLRRSLEPHVLGDRIERVEVRDGRLREPVDARQLKKRVAGHGIERLDRRGKYLLLDLDDGWTLAIHLGMSGRFTLVPDDEPPEAHEHMVFHLASGRKLRLRDPRRFGLVFAYETAKREADPHFAHLGVEPLASGFSGATLRAAACGRRGPVKAFLMDGTVVVGAGNIYAAESLFRARIHPLRSVARISAERWDRLADSWSRCFARRSSRVDDAQRLRRRRGAEQVLPGLAFGLRPRGRSVRTLRPNDPESGPRQPEHVLLPGLPAIDSPSMLSTCPGCRR